MPIEARGCSALCCSPKGPPAPSADPAAAMSAAAPLATAIAKATSACMREGGGEGGGGGSSSRGPHRLSRGESGGLRGAPEGGGGAAITGTLLAPPLLPVLPPQACIAAAPPSPTLGDPTLLPEGVSLLPAAGGAPAADETAAGAARDGGCGPLRSALTVAGGGGFTAEEDAEDAARWRGRRALLPAGSSSTRACDRWCKESTRSDRAARRGGAAGS